MKRIVLSILAIVALVSCYDDTYLREKVNEHDQSLIDLETLIGMMDTTLPQLKVEDEHLWVSYDEGATWEDLGSVGGNSSSGACVVAGVEKFEDHIRLILSNGTVFEIPLKSAAGIKPYYVEEIAKTKASIMELTDEPCLVFPMISDIHYLSVTSEVPDLISTSIDNMLELQKSMLFDFLVCLGDVCVGDKAKNTTQSEIRYVWDQLKRSKLPIYACVGNHDDNRYETDKTQLLDNNMLFNLMMRDAGQVMYDMSLMNGTNFYKDFPHLKIRLVFVNSNEIGGANVVFADQTASWFEYAMNTEYDTYVFSHGSPVNFSRAEDSTTPKNGDKMVSIMRNSPNFKMFFHGHNHYDCEFTAPFNDTNNPILAFSQMCNKCQNKEVSDASPAAAVRPLRTPGTVTEDCFDIVVIRPKSGKVNLVRFGAGVDREFNVNTGTSTGESVLQKLPDTIEYEVDFTKGSPFLQQIVAADDQKAEGETYSYMYPFEGGVYEMQFGIRPGCHEEGATESYELNENGLCFINAEGTHKNADCGAIRLPAIKDMYLNKVEAYMTSADASTTKRVYITTKYNPGVRVDTGVADCVVSPNKANNYRVVFELPLSADGNHPYAITADGKTNTIESGFGSIQAYENTAYTLRMRQADLRVEKLVLKYTKTAPVVSAK